MKIQDINLGGGLFRLEVTPTSCGENVNNVPTHAMDDIMRDVVRRGVGKDTCKRDCVNFNNFTRERFYHYESKLNEPDGFDAHIDRPKRENYCGSQLGFENDMRKYREAERAVKACTWPCKEPMKGVSEEKPIKCFHASHADCHHSALKAAILENKKWFTPSKNKRCACHCKKNNDVNILAELLFELLV